jgi:molybdopterin synthase catalytic subunit
MSIAVQLAAEPFDPEPEIAAFRRANAGAGAVASFTGCVRGDSINALVLEHHPTLTQKTIQAFAAEALARFELTAALVIHRYGRMGPSEPIVLVAAASPHRRQALQAVDFLMDLLKTEAPFWKREEKGDRSVWIEPRTDDYAARDRWAVSLKEKLA